MYCMMRWCSIIWCVGLIGGAAAVVGGAPAAAPVPDDAVVFLQHKGKNTRLEGIKNDKLGYYAFLGIRYAEPPVGSRRFQRPVRRLMSGDIMAKKPCLPCPQQHPQRPQRMIGHEDCLCLSVFTPKMPGEEKGSPVVFFIHGGNYITGSSHPYGGQHLAKKDTILVTLQYRLGSLGFLSTGKRDASGNAGLFDMHAALDWIHDYIEFFGGDPNRVVLMGQGSGGSAASLLSLAGTGRAPSGVAALSGTPLSPGALRPQPESHARSIADHTGCPSKPAERLVACLRKMPAETIVKADAKLRTRLVDAAKFLQEVSGLSGAGARVEDEDDQRGLPPIVFETPSYTLSKKKQRCPILTGVTSKETSRAIFGKYGNFLKGRLKEVSDFINHDLIGGLRKVLQGIDALVPQAKHTTEVNPIFAYYGSIVTKAMKNVNETLAEESKKLHQVAEATADALFNFPAYQSTKLWSAAAPAYLYSFDFVGNLSRGSFFLPGVALTGDSDEKSEDSAPQEGPSHGDELAYIFEPLDEEGNPVGGEVSSTDARVRDSFVSLISNFAHNLKPVVKDKQQKDLFTLQTFSKENEHFIKIGDKISIEKNFRYCQMGLWGDMTNRIVGDVCKGVLGHLWNLTTNLPLKPLIPDLKNPSLPLNTNLLGLGNKINSVQDNNQKQKKKGLVTLSLGLPVV